MLNFEVPVHILMQHYPMSINMHAFIEVQGIGGENAHQLSSKTVIYSVKMNAFSSIQNQEW
jgi:hypothetical protein